MLSPAVDLFVDDLRSGRKWKGESLPLADVRDTVAECGPIRKGDWIAIGLALWAGSILVADMGWDRSIGTRRTT